MKSVRTAIWKVGGNDREWTRDVVSEFLSSLPVLNDLQLEVENGLDIALGPLRGLTRLKVATPYYHPTPLVPRIAKIIVQSRRSLTTLHLVGPSEWSEIWTLLDPRGPSSPELTTNNVTPVLLAYLGSYSGLQRLKLQYPSGSSQSESDHLADTFFSLVVPQHIDSLTDLSCAAGYESRWSFGPHNVDVISQLSRLTSLEISVNAEDVIDVEPGRNAVTLLLHTTTRFSLCATLLSSLADADRNAGARCGRPRMHHMGAVHKYMKAAVDAFHARVPSAAVLLYTIGLASECVSVGGSNSR
ncbi:hypothetical protein B0H13DRAFT_2658113 [Mycena leptocephala]|nr:hypothetical protein B0H13DRAFT_2658113 [Mycena leptocephala]